MYKKISAVILSLIFIFVFSFSCFAASSSIHLKGNEWKLDMNSGTYGGLNASGNPYYIPHSVSGTSISLVHLTYPLTLDSSADYNIIYSIYFYADKNSNAEVDLSLVCTLSDGSLTRITFTNLSNINSTLSISGRSVNFKLPSNTVKCVLDCYFETNVKTSFFCYNITLTGNNLSQQVADGFAQQQQQINKLSIDVQKGFEKTQQQIQQGFDKTQQQIQQGVNDINNAGSDEPPLDTDLSVFQSAIDTMNGWLEELDGFADSIESAGESAHDYISKGTEIFNGFLGVAPASVIALIAFGIVFVVVRKIIGR